MRRIARPRSTVEISCSLVVIDQRPIRDATMDALKKAQTELEELHREFSVFTERDKPAFTSWLSVAFGKLYAELNALTWKIYEKQVLLEAVMREAARLGVSFAEAYRRFNSEQWDPSDEPEPEPEPDPDRERDDEFEGFDEYSSSAHDHRHEQESASTPKAPKSERLKQLYRKLAKLLHPDVSGGEISGEARDLWLKVQAAYLAGDTARLEALLSAVAGDSEPLDADELSMWELKQLLNDHLDSIRAMKRRLRSAHRDRAWAMSRPEGSRRKRRLYRVIKREIEKELQEAQDALATIDQFFNEHVSAA